jgi:transposase
MVELALDSLAPTFDAMYAAEGRPSIPPEHLLKGCLLMALHSIRSERQFCERLQYDLLFKWFLGLNVSDDAFDHSSFAMDRLRLLDHAVSRAFFEAVLVQARQQHLLSNDHFTVNGTLLESWASLKSFQRKPNLGGQRNRNGAGAVAARPPELEVDAIMKSTSGASGAPTRPTSQPPTPRLGWPARATATRPSSVWPGTF